MGSAVLVSGVYGVGKSTLCNKLAQKCHINFYSAGDVISEENDEKYGSNKIVKNKELNQNILIKKISEKLEHEKIILLAGHFCILGNNGQVESLPEHIYSKLQLSAIILLKADSKIIMRNLNSRDGKEYPMQLIEEFLNTERNCAEHIADNLNIPLFIHNMKFSNEDVEENYLFLKEVYGENFIGH